MSVDLDTKKRRNFSNTCASLRKNQQRSKCKKVTRPNGDDGISKSKQLAQKMKTNKSIGRPKTRSTKLNNNDEPRVCGNGTLMPSLPELVKMFEDSDEEEVKGNTDNVPRLVSYDADNEDKTVNTLDITIPNSADGCSTPKTTLTISENNLKSPTTIKNIANKMLDYISNLPDPTVLIDEAPRPAVVPPKKRKKPEIPYIVGCKDREKVEERRKTGVFKGDEEYGVDSPDEEDECPKKRAKRGKAVNISKSIFNAQSDEIAARLKESESALSDGISDSIEGVAYQYYTPPSSDRSQTFSPVPSTSHNSKIFKENDIRFNNSYSVQQPPNEKVDDSVKAINNLPDIITIDDEIINTTPVMINSAVIEIDDSQDQVQFLSSTPANNLFNNNYDNDSCVEIIEGNNNTNATRTDSPIPVFDYYSLLNLNQPNEDDIEIIDVDDVIAENNALINKYHNSNNLDTITFVEPSANKVSLTSSMTQTIDTSIEPNALTQNTDIESEHNNNTHCKLVEKRSTVTMSHNNETIMEIDCLCRQEQRTSPVLEINTPIHISRNKSNNINNKTVRGSSMDAGNLAGNQSGTRNSKTRCGCDSLRSTNDPVVSTQRKKYKRGTRANSRSIPDPVQRETEPCLCRQGGRTSPLFEIFIPESQNECNCTINHTVSDSPMDGGNIADIFTRFISGIIQSETRCVSRRSTNERSPPANSSTSIPVPVQIQTEPLPAEKTWGDCPICMDSLTKNPVASTMCGHLFCLKCIKSAVKANGKKCPSCRKPFKGVGFHQLFI